MRIVSVNVNGIRSAASKGFFDWLSREQPDVVCIQETKAQEHQLGDAVFAPEGYQAFFFDAERKGYSGTAIYSKQAPDRVRTGLGFTDADTEGRWIAADFGKLTIVSLYLPSGSASEERQAAKFDFLEKFMPLLKDMAKDGRDYIICGDWNIAHKNIDLKNWRSNQKNSGFLPEERAWLDELFGGVGFVDAFRVVNQEAEQYTWWSNRGQSWAKNVGWRIDYHVISPSLKDKVKGASIYKDERFSDHAPLILDYAL
ncbi:MAG: exodeoxyribonuclease III [Gammaproteobacteria bacterium]|nr:exodeoxyribonuclease III [Gammaproteobacteria bacterium]